MRKFPALILLSASVCFAQRFPPINIAISDPTGTACSVVNALQQYTNHMYICTSGTWQVVGGGASGSVSGQATGVVPLAGGATTINAQSHLDDGVTTAATITSTEPIKGPSITASVNKVINVTAPPYNAKCDGATDDQTAIQAAFDAAYSGGQSIQFPAGTCKTSTIVWKGQSFFGAGMNLTIVKGLPGQDVFQTPDSAVTLLNFALVRDLTVQVDVTVDASATTAGGNNTFPNRIAGTVQGTTAWNTPIVPGPVVCPVKVSVSLGTPTTVTVGCGITTNFTIINPARVVGAPITIPGAGPAGADLVTTISAIGSYNSGTGVQTLTIASAASTAVTNVTGTMLNPILPPWYIGNAAFALQCSNGNACPGNASSWTFRNILIQNQSGSGNFMQYNHVAGIFTQLALYDGIIDNLTIQYLYAGYIEAAPTTGHIATADTWLARKLNVSSAVLPLITYNGSNRTMNNVNLYASGGIQSMCNFFLNNGQTASTVSTWAIDGLYCEGGYASGDIARWMSGPYKVRSTDYAAGASSGATIQWLASQSTWDGFMGGTLVLAGNGNLFSNTRLLTSQISDSGQNNSFINTQISGTNSYMGRRFNPSPRPPRPAIGAFDGSFLATGNSANPYHSIADLITECDDWTIAVNPAFAGANGTCVTDSTGSEITHRYYQSPSATFNFDFLDAGNAATNAWSGQARVFGSSTLAANGLAASKVPTTKVTVYVEGQCVGAATCTAVGRVKDITANSTVGSTGALSFTNAWSIQSFTTDLSAATKGDVMGFRLDTWVNAGTNYQIAWIGLRPVNNDEHTWLAANGLPVTGGGNLLPSATTGVLCTGPSSAITTGHIATFNGTNCTLQDGGTVPAAVVTSVPLWMQNYGDGSEGAYSCPSGTCDLQTGEHWYTTCNITAGAIVDAKSSTLSAGAPLVLRCSTSATIAGTISYSINTGSSNGTTTAANYGAGSGGGGFGAANGTIGNGYLGAIGAGTAGTSGNAGGNGTATPAYVQKIFLSSGYPYTGTACGGSQGGAGGSSGGAAGRGAGCIIIISPSINFTGTCDVSGQNGVAGGANTGGGGGGGGGICLFRSPSMTNSGVFTLTGGTGGAIGSGTSTKGGDGATGWSKVFTQ